MRMGPLVLVQCLYAILLLFGTGVAALDWPDGTYGLPMAEEGCPDSAGFNWAHGSRLHETNSGSHASDPNHLAGIDTDKSSSIEQKFCIKRTFSADKDRDDKFMPGSYCLFKKGDCPEDFEDGFIYWDDAAPWYGTTEQATSGVLPDGLYDRNTRIRYCCRDDALPSKAIRLPTSSPFYLLQLTEECQKVDGMESQEEWVYWADETTLNYGDSGGLHPTLKRSTLRRTFTKLFYCYYTPEGPNKTFRTVMTVIYVIIGIAGVILLFCFLMCIVQRIMVWHAKRKDCQTNNTENLARESMLQEVRMSSELVGTPTASASFSSGAAAEEPTPTKKVQIRRDGPQVQEPPRYSTLPEAAPPVEVAEDGQPYTAVLPGDRFTMTQPPSYDEVLREDAHQATGSQQD